MNVNDIGREQAGGTLLFKRIFKERRKLEASLTKILVVLRMYDGETPLEILRDDMMRRLEEIWRSANVTSLRFEDYIEVNVVALQAKRSESFQKEVTTLRRLLSKATAVRRLLFPNTTPNHNRSDKVPVSGSSVSLKPIWDTITKKVKLDITTDQAAQLLVMLRAQGDGERERNKAWDQLRGKLVQVATYFSNPCIGVDALLDLLGDARNLRLGHPEAEALLWRIMASLVEETVRALDAGMAIPRLRELLLVVADQLDMVPLCDSEPVQMVDEESNFCEANVADIFKRSAQLSAPNAPYAVVSIVGTPISGKSYLLHHLFGTKFPVMDGRRERLQTTRGIMMSRCIGPSLLVLDFPGFDGRERGQDTLLERQASLFALTISDVILVNMSVHDIHREHGGGIALLWRILMDRTKLPAGLTNILVVLRRYEGETPLELLKHDVMTSLEKMWRSGTEESLKFEDYFEVNVVALPDKNSMDFPKEVTILRRLLSESTINLKGRAKVPASSFSASSRRFWEKIKNNEKLDIPSHQDVVSEFDNEDIDRSIALYLSEEEHKKSEGTGKDLHLDEDEQLPRAIQESLNVESPLRARENGSPPRSRESSSHSRARENGNANGGSAFQQLPFMFSSGLRICAGCHSEIGLGRFLSCMGAVWHPECFCCHACNQPIHGYEFNMSGNHPYHKTCYKERFHPKCDVCKQFIPTNMNGLIEYKAHPFWLQKYCPSHEVDGTPRCRSCERMEPRESRYVLLDDGSELCLECLDSAVMETNECQPLYLEIQEFYEGLNMKVEQQFPLLLVERQALNEAMEREKIGPDHLSETRGLCLSEEQTVSTILRRPRMAGNKIVEMITEPYRLTRRCEVTAILILYGLPRLLTGSILAHEMMHAWLRLKGYRTLSPDIEEGICQVLAHMWIESEIMGGSGGNAASKSSSSSSSISSKKGGRSQFEQNLDVFFKNQIESGAYGDGFRAGNRAVLQYGLKRTLEHIRLTGTLPF